jgi:murein DD-endopeptidase MepM/ murein hydrolase activator NlpD
LIEPSEKSKVKFFDEGVSWWRRFSGEMWPRLREQLAIELGLVKEKRDSVLSLSKDSELFPWRYASHMAVVLLIGLAILAGQWEIPEAKLPAVRPDHWLTISWSRGGGAPRWVDNGSLIKAPVPHTTIPERPRLEVITYTVQTGDSVFGIAEHFGISPQTIMWSNGRLEDNPDLLGVGQELVILPTSGVYHIVEEGDTVEGIAQKYKVEVSAITDYEVNGLKEPYEVTAGMALVVPGGEKPYIPKFVHRYTGPIPEDASKGTGNFVWPASGSITQKFWSHHRAIDIGGYKGAPVVASDSGFVVYAGWDDSGYGRMLLIDHGNGWHTLYAHLDMYLVDYEQSVAQGQQIGTMGQTGNATGPHLHFEMWEGNSKRNPLLFLP